MTKRSVIKPKRANNYTFLMHHQKNNVFSVDVTQRSVVEPSQRSKLLSLFNGTVIKKNVFSFDVTQGSVIEPKRENDYPTLMGHC